MPLLVLSACHQNSKISSSSPIHKSLHWLTINDRIQYKVLTFSLTHIILLPSGHHSYLHSPFSLKGNCATRSSSLITLGRPTNNSRLKITNRPFHLTDPALRNRFPHELCHFSSHASQLNLIPPLFSLSPSFLLKNSNSFFLT
jgi:hypothetical protein